MIFALAFSVAILAGITINLVVVYMAKNKAEKVKSNVLY